MGSRGAAGTVTEPLLVLVAEPQVNLTPLTRQLWAHRIPHRVVFLDGKQQLLLGDPSDIAQVREWVDEWKAGQLDKPDAHQASAGAMTRLFLIIGESPFTVSMLLVWTAILLIGWFDPMVLLHWSTPGFEFWPELKSTPEAWLSMGFWDMWRPALLHFSMLHWLFNMLWWWLVGRALERQDGMLQLFIVMLVAGLVGNAVQWWLTGPGFGGASGIVFGIMGWVGWRQLRGKVAYPVPASLLPVMAGWMVLTIMGDQLIPGLTNTAHAAHLGGLISGIVLASVWPYRQRGST